MNRLLKLVGLFGLSFSLAHATTLVQRPVQPGQMVPAGTTKPILAYTPVSPATPSQARPIARSTGGRTNKMVRIGTYNLWMLPYQPQAKTIKSVSRFFRINPSRFKITKLDTKAGERSRKIPAAIAKLADVWAFQEGFDKQGRQRVRRRMEELGFPHTTHILGRPMAKSHRLTSSGLWFASRYPIVKKKGIYYKDSFKTIDGKKLPKIKSLGDDAIADKGVYYVQVDVGGTPVHIFNTHTQAKTSRHRGEKPAFGELLRKQQFERIRAFIDAQKIPKDQYVFIVGDMNVDEGNPEKRASRFKESVDMKKILNARVADPTDKGFTSPFDPKRAQDIGSAGQRIDYILVDNLHKQPLKSSTKVHPIKLSDHEPLVGTFEIQ